MLYHYGALVFSILVGVTGQILFKVAASSNRSGIDLYLQPVVFFAFSLYTVSAFLYIFALKKVPFTVAYPSLSLSYAIAAYLGHWIWKEPFGPVQIFGICLIGLGVFVLHYFSG